MYTYIHTANWAAISHAVGVHKGTRSSSARRGARERKLTPANCPHPCAALLRRIKRKDKKLQEKETLCASRRKKAGSFLLDAAVGGRQVYGARQREKEEGTPRVVRVCMFCGFRHLYICERAVGIANAALLRVRLQCVYYIVSIS